MRKINPKTRSAGRIAKQPGDYHHGALRDALLLAAQQVLIERGVEAFSLRECARRAGVSHGAPSHHFGDARGLLTAFATQGFEQMGQRMQQYAHAAGENAQARLIAVGRAYIEFALGHPAHFKLMFRSDRLDMANPEFKQASESAAQALAWSLAGALEARGINTATLQERCLLAWSAVHGLAMLVLDADLRAFGVADHGADAAQVTVQLMLDRLLVSLLTP